MLRPSRQTKPCRVRRADRSGPPELDRGQGLGQGRARLLACRRITLLTAPHHTSRFAVAPPRSFLPVQAAYIRYAALQQLRVAALERQVEQQQTRGQVVRSVFAQHAADAPSLFALAQEEVSRGQLSQQLHLLCRRQALQRIR